MIKLMVIAAGGALGTIMRYGLAGFVQNSFVGVFPYGTLVVNLIGSAIIGILWGLSEIFVMPGLLRVFAFVGILGAFTTFSTFSLETLNLLRDGEIKLALINILLSNVLGIALAYCGFVFAKQVFVR